nr:sugar fermentation stimulation protein homolog [Nerophis lumbriciformis]
MRFDLPLQHGVLIQRYKRFLADVELEDGSRLTVHCPNSGSMKACSEPGRPVVISDSGNPKRKLRHTLEMIRMGRTWRGRIPELAGYGELRREVPYAGRSRIDLLLRDPAGQRPDAYVEIKNATYLDGEHAAFPDAVTERGRKHLEDLAEMVSQGHRSVIFYFIGRADCRRMRPADEIDPAYGEELRRAVGAGVEALAYGFRFSPGRGIELVGSLPVDL